MEEEQPGAGEGLAALVAETRRLIRAVRTLDADVAVATGAAASIGEVADSLEPYVHAGPVSQGSLRGNLNPLQLRDLGPSAFFSYSPAVGHLNPVAPEIEVEVVAGDPHVEVVATSTLGAPHAGPPNIVHGGVIALLFDDIMGSALVANECGAMTGTLEVRYLRPTPIGVPTTWRGGIGAVDGRKVSAWAEVHVAGECTARATGLFVRVDLLEVPPTGD